MDAVLGPGLRQRFQFDIGGVPALPFIIADDSLKFVTGKPETSGKSGLIRAQDIDRLQFKVIFRIFREADVFSLNNVLDDGIHQQPAANSFHLPVIKLSGDEIAPGRPGSAGSFDTEVTNRFQDGFFNRVINTSVESHLDGMEVPAFAGSLTPGIAISLGRRGGRRRAFPVIRIGSKTPVFLGDRVSEEAVTNQVQFPGRQVSVQPVDIGHPDIADGVYTQVTDVPDQALSLGIRQVIFQSDFNPVYQITVPPSGPE